jgi:hypothetical protein
MREKRAKTDKHALHGALEFDLTVNLLGKTITRRARAVYTHTPDPDFGIGGDTTYQLEIRAAQGGSNPEGAWVELPIEDLVSDAIFDAIGAKCSEDDRKRRRAEGDGKKR